jgi:hypothetical protein
MKQLARTMGALSGWSGSAANYVRLKLRGGGRRGTDIVITGIPRSGTSYLCNLLHRYDNCVIVNEPPEMGEAQMFAPTMHAVKALHRSLRNSIIWNRPILNKLLHGKVVEDTMVKNERSYYSPQVESADFVLGTKNPLAYLLRLREIREVMPNARIAVCIRNPFDTIASWKKSFDQMKNADVAKWFKPRYPAGIDSELAREVLECRSASLRRIWWWRLLAEVVLQLSDVRIQIVRYHELVANPTPFVEAILKNCNPGTLREPLLPSQPRVNRNQLDSTETNAISDICGETARRLGVIEN